MSTTLKVGIGTAVGLGVGYLIASKPLVKTGGLGTMLAIGIVSGLISYAFFSKSSNE